MTPLNHLFARGFTLCSPRHRDDELAAVAARHIWPSHLLPLWFATARPGQLEIIALTEPGDADRARQILDGVARELGAATAARSLGDQPARRFKIKVATSQHGQTQTSHQAGFAHTVSLIIPNKNEEI